MRTKLLAIVSTLALIALCGCLSQSVPQSKIEIAGTKFALPKNSKIGTLVIELPTTNGTVRFYATNCVWENDANVLNAVTSHDVSVLNAISSGISSAVAAGTKSTSP